MQLSLVIPAYNEGAKIHKDIEVTAKYLQGRPHSSELIIVDDGSRDDTGSVARRAAERFGSQKVKIRVVDYGGNRGKGFAVRYGIEQAEGAIIGFMDSGLCVPLRYIEVAIAAIENGAPFAIASRRLPGTRITRAQPLYRRVGSKVFWYLMKGLMGVQVTDTQCGFKFFSREVAKGLFSSVRTDGFMFDIESLMIAGRRGLKGVEFAVEWANDSDSRYHVIYGTIKNLREIVKIRYRLLTERV